MTQIIVPSIPKRHVITQGMIETLLYSPVMAAKIFFNAELDAFQSAALKIQWASADTEDFSGHGSSKTFRAWILANLSCILLAETCVGVIYQNHQIAKQVFWRYYSDPKYMTPLFRSQLGRFDKGSHKERPTSKEPGNWTMHFKSGGRIEMPAPGHSQDAEKLGSWEVHRLVIDESNKVRKLGEGIENQLLNRVRLQCWHSEHPVFGRKIWRMGTAETADHPGFAHHQVRVKAEKAGDPTLYSFGFCYRDWSNIICPTGKAFRDQVPNWKTIKASNREMTRAKRLAEGLGIYAENSAGWYDAESINGCEEAGRKRGLEIVLSRAMDKEATDETRYFCGIDAARSANKGNDEGAIVVLRANPRVEQPTENDADWDLCYIYARVVLNHDGGMWSGCIHELNKFFGFTTILMDPGGSDFISCELKKERQTLNQVETRCSPIVTRDDTTVASGSANFILSLTRSADVGVRNLWPDLAHARSGGGDTLKYFMNSAFQAAWEKGFLVLPAPYSEFQRAKQTDGWVRDKIDAHRQLNPKMKSQILSIHTLMDDKGHYKLTSNNAVQFTSLERDDFHDAGRNAYVAFRIWLRENEGAYMLKSGDSGMFYGGGAVGGSRGAAIDG